MDKERPRMTMDRMTTAWKDAVKADVHAGELDGFSTGDLEALAKKIGAKLQERKQLTVRLRQAELRKMYMVQVACSGCHGIESSDWLDGDECGFCDERGFLWAVKRGKVPENVHGEVWALNEVEAL